MTKPTPSRTVKIGGWTLQQFGQLTGILAIVAAVVGIGLIAFKAPPIYVWTLILVLFVVLGVRVVLRRGREIHLFTVGWTVGLPLGFLFALVEVVSYRNGYALTDLVRLPILVALVGILVASATGFALTHHITTKHVFFGESHPPKRKHA